MHGEKEPLLNWLMRFLNRWEGMEVEWRDGSKRPFVFLSEGEKAEYLIAEVGRIYVVQASVGSGGVLAVPGEPADDPDGEGSIGEHRDKTTPGL